MPIILSVIARIIFFCGLSYVAFLIGIGVAMGFDAGISLGASLVAFLYLFTFIPALLLTVIPFAQLTKPPLVLKVWYWWIALIASIWTLLWAFNFSKIMLGASLEILDRTIGKNNYVTICQQVVNSAPDEDVSIGIGNSHRSVSYRAWAKQYCSTYPLSDAPFKVLLGDPQHPLVALDIPVTGGGKTCVGLTRQNMEWAARVIDCAH